MRKKFLEVALAATMTISTTAVEFASNVGENTDPGWWTVFSDYYTLSDGEDVTVDFTLHSKAVNNWDGWLLVLHTAGTERQGDGYSEYAVLRQDNYGWGGVVEGWWNDPAPEAILERECNITDWEAYKATLDGSKVAMKLAKEGTVVTVDATTVGTDGNTYTLYLKIDTGVSGDIGFFFTVDSAWLEGFTIVESNQSGENGGATEPLEPESPSEPESSTSSAASDSTQEETTVAEETQRPEKVSIGDKIIVVDVSEENVPEGAKMNVAEVTDEVELEKVEKAIESKFAKEIKKYAVLDLNMMVGTEKVQPLNNGKVSFETEHFSTYVIAEKVAAETESEPSSPKTGDTAPIALLLVAALSACGAVVVSKRRETR